MGWDMQHLKHKKVWGDYMPGTRPLQYRRKDWDQLIHGKGRTVALVFTAMLGVPTFHGENETPVWTFQFDDGGLLVIHYRKGGHSVEVSAKTEESRDLQSAWDFLINEVRTRLLVVSGAGTEE